MRKVILLAGLMLLAPAVSQAKTLEELLVEKGVITKGEAKSAMAATPGSVSYARGVRWDFSDKKFSGQINTMIQTRYTFTDKDKEASDRQNTSSFDVTKARVILTGNVLDKEFSYKLEGDFVGTSSDGTKGTSLKDAFIGWKACDWMDLKMGQFKTNFGRQYNASDASQQFPDRSNVSDYFDLGRQAGAHASLKTADMPVTVGAGIFNGESSGEGENRSGVDTNHTGIVNVRWNVMGQQNVNEEGDVGGTEDAALNVGAAYAYSDVNVGENNAVNADLNFKFQGWSANAEYFWGKNSPDSGSDVKPSGFYVQGGYMVVPGSFELAARYSFLDCDDGAASGVCSGNDNVNGVDFSANYFFWAHQLKAQLAWSMINEDRQGAGGADINTDRIIFQLAGYF